jgi:phosphoglycerate dehydrogenase-like enzyme
VKILFLTERGARHQQDARRAAPEGCEVVMLRRPPREVALAEITDADFLISERSGEIDGAIIAAGKRLRLIQRLGTLAYDIDLDAAKQAGIPVCIWPLPSCIYVAEHMVMQMLALAKRLPEVKAIAETTGKWGRPSLRTDENTFAYNWSRRSGISGLYGKTAGILGFGEIGAELARRLHGFALARLFYHKRRRLPVSVEAQLGLDYAAPEQIVAESDFVCVLLPYSPETDRSIDAGVLARMKPGSFLVSCDSGSVIDEAALADALRSGHLGGAALDTFEWEPLRPDNPLVEFARDPAMNVLLTPHTAAGAPVGGGGGRAEEYANIQRVLAGEAPLHRVA